VSFFLLGICTSAGYKYVPIQDQVNATRSRSDIIYSEPPQRPEGRVKIRSLGIADIEPKPHGQKVRSLHIRLAISHQGSRPWEFNTRDQTVSFPNSPQMRPFWVNTDDSHLPNLVIPSNELRVVDLYFRLPSSYESADNIPEFEFYWNLLVGNQKIAESTPFDRVQVSERVATVYPYDGYPAGMGLGWGPVWWMDPFYFPG
jgi:hypothetical protein